MATNINPFEVSEKAFAEMRQMLADKHGFSHWNEMEMFYAAKGKKLEFIGYLDAYGNGGGSFDLKPFEELGNDDSFQS